MVDSQHALARAVSVTAGAGANETQLDAAGRWLTGGTCKLRQDVSLGYTIGDTITVGPERWAWEGASLSLEGQTVRFSRVDVSGQDGSIFRPSEQVTTLVSPSGCQVIVDLRDALSAVQDDDTGVSATATGSWGMFHTHQGRLDIQPDFDGGSALHSPPDTFGAFENFEGLPIGAIDVPGDPDPAFLAESAGVYTLDAELLYETLWLIPIDPEMHPHAIETAEGVLQEGSAFWVYPGLLVLRVSPHQLFPDRVIHCASATWTPRCARHHTLKLDRHTGAGYHVARYKRLDQGPKQLLRALGELADIQVFEQDGVVRQVTSSCDLSTIYVEGQKPFIIPTALHDYSPGQPVAAGEVAGDIVRLVCLRTHGTGWFWERGWVDQGLPLEKVLGGPVTGLWLNESLVPAVGYTDPVGGAEVRVKLLLGQDETKEKIFWDWYACMERQRARTGSAAYDLAELLPLSDYPFYLAPDGTAHRVPVEGGTKFTHEALGTIADGTNALVSPFEVFLPVLGDRILVYETSIWRYSITLFNEMRDFLDREKPAGALVFLVKV